MSSRKVRRYLDAKREYDTYCRQRDRFPELKDNDTHARDLREARAAWLVLLRTLTGGELAAARLAEREPSTLTQKEPTDA